MEDWIKNMDDVMEEVSRMDGSVGVMFAGGGVPSPREAGPERGEGTPPPTVSAELGFGYAWPRGGEGKGVVSC